MTRKTTTAEAKRSYMRGWRQKGVKHPLSFDGRKRFQHTNLSKLVEAGCTCGEMARLCRTNLSNIHYAIRTKGLRSQLREAQITRFTRDARLAWTLAIGRNPGLSQNRLVKLEPRAFHWLWRYDSGWLSANRPVTFARFQKPRSDAAPPRGRGAAVARAIRLAAKAIKAVLPCKRCTKSAIRNKIGISEYALNRMRGDRHVQKAMDSVVESLDEFRRRKLGC